METNYNALRIPDSRGLSREHGLRGYFRLRKAELIALLRDNLRPTPSPRPRSKPVPVPRPSPKPIPAPRPPLKPIPAPRPPSKPVLARRPSQSVKLQPKCTRPPKPIRPPLPPLEDSFDPYIMERAFKKVNHSFRINARSRMDVETFLKETRGSVINLMTEELQDLDLVKVQMTSWIQFKVEVKGEDGSIINFDAVKKAFSNWITEVFQRSDLKRNNRGDVCSHEVVSRKSSTGEQ